MTNYTFIKLIFFLEPHYFKSHITLTFTVYFKLSSFISFVLRVKFSLSTNLSQSGLSFVGRLWEILKMLAKVKKLEIFRSNC